MTEFWRYNLFYIYCYIMNYTNILEKLHNFSQYIIQLSPVPNCGVDICNGAKHFGLQFSQPKTIHDIKDCCIASCSGKKVTIYTISDKNTLSYTTYTIGHNLDEYILLLSPTIHMLDITNKNKKITLSVLLLIIDVFQKLKDANIDVETEQLKTEEYDKSKYNFNDKYDRTICDAS